MTYLPSDTPTLPSTIDELSNHCFGCGPSNPEGLHLVFTLDTSNAAEPFASAPVYLAHVHGGAPGYGHGGIIATLLDEAMSKLNRPLHVMAMTRHMEVDYLRPVPLLTPLVVTARHLRRDGRKLFHHAELLTLEGTVLARGKGLFVVLSEEHLATARGNMADLAASR